MKPSKKQVRDIERKYAQRVTQWAANKALKSGKVFKNEYFLWARVASDCTIKR